MGSDPVTKLLQWTTGAASVVFFSIALSRNAHPAGRPAGRPRRTPMNFPQLNRLKPFKAALCYGLFLAVMILTIKAKSNYHMDEISSYGLANHVGGINLTFEQKVKYTPAEAPT